MKIRIGGNRLGKAEERCSSKDCRHHLEGEPVYEWNWFIQDGKSSFDGEEHHVTLCRGCYEKMEKKFVRHVVSSNEIDQFIAYGSNLNNLPTREKERLGKNFPF